MLHIGQPFPDFSLPNQDKQIVRLRDFAGKWLALFVYPKDDTPGCTIEGRGFSAAYEDFKRVNARVVGVSADDPDSHKSFCNKFDFKMPLLADVKGDLLNMAEVGQSEYKGTMYWNRVTYLIDPKGLVRKIYRDVKPQDHEKAVLADIRSFGE